MTRDDWIYFVLVAIGLLVAMVIGGYPAPFNLRENWWDQPSQPPSTEGYAAAGGNSVTGDHFPYVGTPCPYHSKKKGDD